MSNSSTEAPHGPSPSQPASAAKGGLFRRRSIRVASWLLFATAALLLASALGARLFLRSAARDALPQISGSILLPELAGPVSVARDSHGIPSLHALTFPDLLFAQGFVTAQDRLFQMDLLRRHAAGELAEIFGARLIPHDRAQRILSLGTAADRIVQHLPADQLADLQRYSDGVNAELALSSSGAAHATDPARPLRFPLEFRVLAYQPRPWTPRDCVLIFLVLFQDLSNSFPTKLDREALSARLAPTESPETRAMLLADLYPVGSWRDHPPSQPATDLTAPTDFQEIPLDDSQVLLHPAAKWPAQGSADPAAISSLERLLAPACPTCRSGSNNWAVAGTHTASGRPLLSNDMHLALTAPSIWYTVHLSSDRGPDAPTSAASAKFNVAGVSLPGIPWVVVGHNDHTAWGFTNLGADAQDLYIEHLRGAGTTAEFATPLPDGSTAWRPVLHRSEHLRVRGAKDVTLDVVSTEHGGTPTPVISPLLAGETRSVALRWTLYDTVGSSLPFASVNAAPSAAALAEAISSFSGPSENLIAADDAGHILYHAVGRIPVRGSLASPAPLSPIPTDSLAPDASLHEWAGFVPYDQLPSTVDPTGGVLATANARITPNAPTEPLSVGDATPAPPPPPYPYPLTLNWADPYRNERIWHELTGTSHLTLGDMRRLQMDVFSDADQRLAHRFAYAIDHTPDTSQRLREAADILRSWDGEVRAGTPAPAITLAARSALWRLLLAPRVPSLPAAGLLPLYVWGERDFAQEQIVAHMPARWLPSSYSNWDSLLSAAVEEGLRDGHAPHNLRSWSYGRREPTELQLSLFAQSRLLSHIFGMPTGTRPLALSGDGETIRQNHRNFGPSERFSVDLSDPASATLVLPLGESGQPASPWLLDQLPAWLSGDPLPLPFAASTTSGSTLTLLPRVAGR